MTLESVTITGGCLCGAVRYEAEGFLDDAFYCHCRMCQRASGTPAEISVPLKPGSLRFTRGTPKHYQSSPFGKRGFCPDCGSRLCWTPLHEAQAHWLSVTVGSLDEPERAVPQSHGCVESQLPWYRPNDGLPRRRTEEDPEMVAAWAAAAGEGE